MNYTDIYIQIAALIFIIIIGYLLKKKNIISDAGEDSIIKIVLYVAIPALIITSMQKEFSLDILKDVGILFIISIIYYILFFFLSIFFVKLLRIPEEKQGIYRFLLIFSNSAFIGYPVLMAVVGEEAIFYAAFFNFFFQPLAFTIGPYLIEKEHHEFSFKHFLNPAIIATLVGLVIFILQIELPVFINTPLDMVAEITNPLSMIVIGASLANVNFKKIFGNWQLYAYSIIRLFVIPMVVFFTLNAITDETLLIVIPSIVSGMPAPATAVIVSKIFGTEVDVLNASEGVFMSTVLSMISIPVIAAIIMMNI